MAAIAAWIWWGFPWHAPSPLHRSGGFWRRCLPLPFVPGVLTAKAVWHERSHQDGGHRWFLGVVRELLAQPAPAAPTPRAVEHRAQF